MRIILTFDPLPTPTPSLMHEDDRLAAFLRHKPALLDNASGLVGRAHAEDVMQEAWLRFAQPLPELRQPGGYLFRMVRNLALDLVRRSRWEATGEVAETVLMSAPSTAATPEEQAIASDDLRVVLQALEELPTLQRRAFEMHRFEEATYSRIATTLGVSQGKAHALVQAALAHCLQRLLAGDAASARAPAA